MTDLTVPMRDIMEVKPYTPDNHKILASWWKAHDWDVLPQTYLPKTGFMAWQGEIPIAACFLYTTDSVFAMMEWAISNPTSYHEQRHEAMNMIVKAIMKHCKEHEIEAIYTMTNHPSLVRSYKELGFIEADKEIISFIKRIE